MTTLHTSGLGKQHLDDLAEKYFRQDGKEGHFCLLSQICDPANQPEGDAGLEVKPSRYGNGLFATRPIAKGTLITLYPGHLIIDFMSETPRIYNFTNNDSEEDPEYAVAFTDKILYQGNPQYHGGLCYGHMINDPCTFVGDFNQATKRNIHLLICRYKKQAEARANCEFHRSTYFVWIRATKNISPGEEILLSYGHRYWMKGVTHLL